MSPRIEQIFYILNARIGVSGFTSAGGTSDTINSALNSALSTASRSGGSVPLQVGSSAQEGIETATGKNLTPLYDSQGHRLLDTTGTDVYGKVTFGGTNWTLSYFSAPGGTEAPISISAGTLLGFEFDYRFNLADLPRSAISATTDRRISPDPAQTGMRLAQEILAVTADNTLAAASNAQTGAIAYLIVNNLSYRATGPTPPCAVSGKAWSWNQANAGFKLIAGDDVVAVYSF